MTRGKSGALEYMTQLYATNRPQVLIVILPWNAEFYESHGLAKDQWAPLFQQHRKSLKALGDNEYVNVIDFFNNDWRENGFRDRMHMDAFGSSQVTERLKAHPTFKAFIAEAFPDG